MPETDALVQPSYIKLKLTDSELRQILVYLIAPADLPGENSIEMIDVIHILLKAVERN